MALEIALNFKSIALAAAYVRISYIGLSRKNATVAIEVEQFADSGAKDGPALDVTTHVLRNVPELKDAKGVVTQEADPKFDNYLAGASAGKDPVALAYIGLKTLPVFTGAKDV